MELFGSDMLITIVAIIISLVIALMTYTSKSKLDMKIASKEKDEIENYIKKIGNTITIENKKNDVHKNIITMMIENVGELREYYVISKQQARRSFSASLFICFFGIIIYVIGIVAYVFFEKNISIISIIAGTVVEVIAGLFFWLYREATKQLGIYHQRLGSTEKYLIAIQIIEDMQTDNKAMFYNKLLESILIDNREIIKHENSK